MPKAYIEQIAANLSQVCPELELAVFDSKGKLLLSRPAPMLHRLPAAMESSLSPLSASGRFVASLTLQQDGVLSFTQKVSSAQEAQSLYHLAENIIDLNYQISSLQYSLNVRQDENLLFLNRLFNAVTEDDAAYVTLSALRFGYEMALERAVCVFEICMNDSDEKLYEAIFSSILKIIRSFPGFSEQDILAQLNERQIVLCHELSPDKAPLRERCYPFLSGLYTRLLEQFNISLQIGVSNPPATIQEYGGALIAAQNALRFARIFRSNRPINFGDDFILEAEIADLPAEVTQHFFAESAQILRQSNQLFETVDALVKNNMDLNAAANYLYVHRNTVVFRVNQIKKKLRLNPIQKDSDRFALVALYIYMTLHENDEHAE